MSIFTYPDTAHVDVATQTSPINSPSSSSSARPASPKMSTLTATSGQDSAHLSTMHVQSEDEDASPDDCMPLKVSSASGCDQPGQLHSLNRPSTIRIAKIRAVSLPENFRKDSLRLTSQVEDPPLQIVQQPRVVSMPAVIYRAEMQTSSEALDEPECKNQLVKEPQSEDAGKSAEISHSASPSTPRTVVVHPFTPDTFDTPSPPPSSSDSVEFTLDDPVVLSDSFLRSSISSPITIPEKSVKSATFLEDDGWITWANSPPRPIPALHGPSSLPYARCPSGAEGTVIEEQSSMSRMIWGLDPNDTTSALQIPRQHSRVGQAKPSVSLTRCDSLHAPSTGKPAAVHLSMPSSAGRIGYGESTRDRVQDQSLRVALAESSRPEGTRGLGFIVPRGARHKRNDCGHAADCSKCYENGFLDTSKPDVESVPSIDEEQDWDERRLWTPADVPRRCIPDLTELLSSPVRTSAYNSINRASRMTSYSLVDNSVPHLPTPPNSTSPQWTSAFSPIRNNSFSTAMDLASSGGEPFTNFKVFSKMSATSDEFSLELRRFLADNMRSVESGSLQSRPTTYFSAVPSYSFSQPTSFIGGYGQPRISIQKHSPLESHPTDTKAAKNISPQSSTTPLYANNYRRSTLSNPRSIPLSRLRQNQERNTIKLATVPEEDIEFPALKFIPSTPHNSSHVPLRTPSPLVDRLQPQSVEEVYQSDKVRVKLPRSDEHYAGDVPRDLNTSTTATRSPKKKRYQRKRKAALSRVENARGFPLISEGTVTFGS